jgi:hypothetical protein
MPAEPGAEPPYSAGEVAKSSWIGNYYGTVFEAGGVMSKKADFSEQEWDSLQRGVVGAGLLVSLSDRSFFDTFKEAGALGKHVAQAKRNSTSELIRELADVHGTGFGVTSSPDVVERETLEALQTAKKALESKAPDELEAYRQFVLEIAQSVSEAAGGGETAESAAIEKIRSAIA